jgi:hypothetical protein
MGKKNLGRIWNQGISLATKRQNLINAAQTSPFHPFQTRDGLLLHPFRAME